MGEISLLILHKGKCPPRNAPNAPSFYPIPVGWSCSQRPNQQVKVYTGEGKSNDGVNISQSHCQLRLQRTVAIMWAA